MKDNINTKYKNIKTQKHPFHLITPSPWPIWVSFSTLYFVIMVLKALHKWTDCPTFKFNFFFSIFLVSFGLYFWFRDILRESVWDNSHTPRVANGLRIGFMLFITSEVMFFFSFFWAFFHASLAPSIGIGCTWPPKGIEILDPLGFPFTNTVILLVSGITITIAHRALMVRHKKIFQRFLIMTVLLGIFFTCLQIIEYKTANFSINDGIYGSIFYMATGFHGIHVLIGTLYLIHSIYRSFSKVYPIRWRKHIGFETAAWYWHFVDVVWLFLYGVVYWWGSS